MYAGKQKWIFFFLIATCKIYIVYVYNICIQVQKWLSVVQGTARTLNPLQDNKILDQSKLKQIADDILKYIKHEK